MTMENIIIVQIMIIAMMIRIVLQNTKKVEITSIN